MKVIIAGSRSINFSIAEIDATVKLLGVNITALVNGGAKGIDSSALAWAESKYIPVRLFLPKYDKYPGRVAPLMRNIEMANEAELLIALWDGKSGGTNHMISQMRKLGKTVLTIKIEEKTDASIDQRLSG